MNPETTGITVAVYLQGAQLQPERITRILGVEPSRTQVKGGLAWGSTKHAAKKGMWTLIARTDSVSVADHVNELLDRIGARAIPLTDLEYVEEAWLDVFVTVDEADGARETIEFTLTNSHIERLRKLGLFVRVTVC